MFGDVVAYRTDTISGVGYRPGQPNGADNYSRTTDKDDSLTETRQPVSEHYYSSAQRQQSKNWGQLLELWATRTPLALHAHSSMITSIQTKPVASLRLVQLQPIRCQANVQRSILLIDIERMLPYYYLDAKQSCT